MTGSPPWPTDPSWVQDDGTWHAAGATLAARCLAMGIAPPAWDDPHARDADGNTLLHYWASAPHPDTDWAAVRRHLDPAHAATTPAGVHPFAILIERGCETALALWIADCGWPAEPAPGMWLRAAAWSGHACITRRVLDHVGPDPDPPDTLDQVTALMVACHRHGPEALGAWLDFVPDARPCDRERRTAAHHLAQHGDLEHLLRLEDLGAPLDVPDIHGWTAQDLLARSSARTSGAIRAHWSLRAARRLLL